MPSLRDTEHSPDGTAGSRLCLQTAAPATAWSAPQARRGPDASGPNAVSGPAPGRGPKRSTALLQRRDAEHPAGDA
jgi:hypothetical protein